MRARRSTVALVAVFLVTLVTYTFVRPDDPAARAVTSEPVVPPSATPSATAPPTPSETPTPTDEPEPTETEQEEPSVEPAPTAEPTSPSAPTSQPDPSVGVSVAPEPSG